MVDIHINYLIPLIQKERKMDMDSNRVLGLVYVDYNILDDKVGVLDNEVKMIRLVVGYGSPVVPIFNYLGYLSVFSLFLT